MLVEGPAVEAFLYQRYAIDPWREGLQTGTPLAAPAVPFIRNFVLSPGTEVRQTVALPKGSYVLVFDHSSKLGQVNPPFNLLGMVGSGSARISYGVELGENP
jgi:hypothetical protein